jgi:DNA mismatch repair protein MutS2
LLAHLLERGITTLVTTHHPELKAFAHAAPGAVNASVEFDLETLRPTFHLTIGLPGRSNALAIAQRLGLPEAIIANARSELSPEDLRAEDLLNEIHQQRELARQARAAAELARRNAEGMRDELLERLEKIEDERRRVLEEARQGAQAEIQELNGELAEVRKAMLRARQPVDALQAVEDKVEELAEEFEQPVERTSYSLPVKEAVGQPRPIRLGDKVRLRLPGGAASAVQGVVSALSQEEAEVQVGALRVRARLAELQLASKDTLPERKSPTEDRRRISGIASQESSSSGRKTSARPTSFSLPESPGLELDLRGKTSEEALEALERYLDAAYLTGLPFVRIIHGKGTGKLRDVVRRFLHGHPQVRSFEPGGEHEGGEGVTVVKLAN